MSDTHKPPYPTKFKPGDYVNFEGSTWKIDDWCLVNKDEHAYEISRPSGKGSHIKGVRIKDGDAYFTKV